MQQRTVQVKTEFAEQAQQLVSQWAVGMFGPQLDRQGRPDWTGRQQKFIKELAGRVAIAFHEAATKG